MAIVTISYALYNALQGFFLFFLVRLRVLAAQSCAGLARLVCCSVLCFAESRCSVQIISYVLCLRVIFQCITENTMLLLEQAHVRLPQRE